MVILLRCVPATQNQARKSAHLIGESDRPLELDATFMRFARKTIDPSEYLWYLYIMELITTAVIEEALYN